MNLLFLKSSFLKGATIWSLLFFSNSLFAQSKINAVITDSTSFAFLPAVAYNSDYGFMVGGIVNRFHYKTDNSPFYSFINIAGIVSTGGLASGSISYDKPNFTNTKLRFIGELYAARFFEDPYFGIGSYQKIPNSTSIKGSLYNFKSISTGFDITLRYPLKTYSSGKQLDVLAILGFTYETPWDNDSNRLIAQQQPLGYTGGHTVTLGSGFIWEGRNSEFRPTKGQYAKSSLEIGQTWFGSDYNTTILRADARNYLSFFLIREITLANRIYFKHTAGEVPYWDLAYAGDEETLRGYPARRFLDDNAIILNTELRTWLFRINALDADFGGTLFFDLGRTFPNGESLQAISEDLKYSFGFGGTSSFFTPDFVLRTDFGFSEEGMGVYFTAGYMF